MTQPKFDPTTPIPIRIWHDDLRRPPASDWTWCRSNDKAKGLLQHPGFEVTEISLDHDLGGSHIPESQLGDADFVAMHGDETGVDLMTWMCRLNLVPDKVRIHSMSSVGAANIYKELQFWVAHEKITNQIMLEVRPFDPSERAE